MQEVRFLRVDDAGKPVGNADAILFESSTVPPLCPQVPDLIMFCRNQKSFLQIMIMFFQIRIMFCQNEF